MSGHRLFRQRVRDPSETYPNAAPITIERIVGTRADVGVMPVPSRTSPAMAKP